MNINSVVNVSLTCNMSHLSYLVFFSLLIQFYGVNTANILGLFSHTGKSHHMFFEPLLLKLTERGHNMTVASFFPVRNPPPNYNDISFQGLAEIRISSYDLDVFEGYKIVNKIPVIGRIAEVFLSYQPFATSALNICEKLINFQPLLNALKRDYDLVLMESFMSDCMLGLLHVFGIRAPIVSISSTKPLPWASGRVGVVDNPSYVPSMSTSFSSKMSLLERLENTLLNFFLKKWHYIQIQSKEKGIIEKKFGEIPDLSKLEKNISLMLTNSYHTLNGVKPLVPGMVEVGGMHLDNRKQRIIPQFIAKFLNESSEGVILFSFGSHIKTKSLPKYKEQMFITALSKLKQRVVWKFEDSGEEGSLVGNILRVNWLPQHELLQHEKVVAFLCHGGLLGMTEATAAGKPMIVIPFFGDQPTNAAAAADAGVGIVLSYVDLTEDSLSNALQTVISDEMRQRARLVSNIWRDKETAPLECAVFWTEHAARWGRFSRLHSAARDLSLAQLSLLDVVAVIIISMILIITAIICIILKLIKIYKKGTKEKLL